MALYGRVGNGQEIHKIGMALFEYGKAAGRSICGTEGDVIMVDTRAANCQKCRDKSIGYEMKRMSERTKAPRKLAVNVDRKSQEF